MNQLAISAGKFEDGTELTIKAPEGAVIAGFRPEDADDASENGTGRQQPKRTSRSQRKKK